MIRAGALVAAMAVAAPVLAGTPDLSQDGRTLDGRLVTFTVMTWDDPAQPYLQARGRTVVVGDGVEFGLGPEGLTAGLDVVPVEVEILPQRVELTYPAVAGVGPFYEAAFNGYVLRFDTECKLFAGWKVDQAVTTLPVTDDDIFTDRGALYINVSGLTYAPDERIAVDLDVTDCPMS